MAADGNRPVQADGNRLLRQAIAYGGGWTVALGAAALFGAVAELLLPAALGLAVDAALGGADRWWPLAACGLVLLIVATDTLSNLAAGAGTARTTARLRHRLLGHLLALDPRRATRYPVGDLVGRLVGQAADSGQAGSTVVFGVAAALPRWAASSRCCCSTGASPPRSAPGCCCSPPACAPSSPTPPPPPPAISGYRGGSPGGSPRRCTAPAPSPPPAPSGPRSTGYWSRCRCCARTVPAPGPRWPGPRAGRQRWPRCCN
ncbi:hypothetical protein [Plantactinospora veratri]